VTRHDPTTPHRSATDSGTADSGTADSGTAVRARGISHAFPTAGQVVRALTDVDVDVARGAVTALVGPSGSGKSTLLRILACLQRPERGSVALAGIETTALSARARRALRRTHIGYVFQDPADNLLDYLTVGEHLTLGARLRGNTGTSVPQEILHALGLADRVDHHPRELSGGEQQRAALAFAAAGSPTLLVADEPTAQLDPTATGRVLDALRRLADHGHAVLAATHDPQVGAIADRVVELVDGRHVEPTP
jgi:putative ABC transport system ATP-binding protein